MHIIIGMPLHIIIIGAPIIIMAFIASHRSFMRGIIDASVGIIVIIMPSFVISHFMVHIMGIMLPIIMGIMPMPPIIGFIMPFIIGIMPMPPIMPFIIGIMFGIMPIGIIIGIMPFGMLLIGMLLMGIPFMGIPLMGIPFMGIPLIIEPFIIGDVIAFMASSIRGPRKWWPNPRSSAFGTGSDPTARRVVSSVTTDAHPMHAVLV